MTHVSLLTSLGVLILYNIILFLCACFLEAKQFAVQQLMDPFWEKLIWLNCSSPVNPSPWSTPATDLSTH